MYAKRPTGSKYTGYALVALFLGMVLLPDVSYADSRACLTDNIKPAIELVDCCDDVEPGPPAGTPTPVYAGNEETRKVFHPHLVGPMSPIGLPDTRAPPLTAA